MSDSDSLNDALRPGQFCAFLGIKERRGRIILAELEALGFALPIGQQGMRLCPPKLAAAAKTAREGGKELAVLRLNPALSQYLRRDARGVEPDPLDILIYTAAEVGIVREVLALLAGALDVPSVRANMKSVSWTNAGLPDPRNGL